MKYHPSITQERIIEAVRAGEEDCSDIGFCLACGEEAECVEPDARRYECDYCHAHEVYGAEECLLMGVGS